MIRSLGRSTAMLSFATMLAIVTSTAPSYGQDPFANQDAIDALEHNDSRTSAENRALAAEYEKQAQAAKVEAAKYRKYADDYQHRTTYKWGANAAKRSNRLAHYYDQLAADDLTNATELRSEVSPR